MATASAADARLDGFGPPDFYSPLDVDALLARVPLARRCRGFFLSFALAHARAAGCEVPFAHAVAPHEDLPLGRALEGMTAVARALHPEVPLREGLRRVGRLSYAALMSSPVGRVLFAFASLSPSTLLRLAPRAARLSGAPVSIETREIAERRFILVLEHFFSFRETLLGAVEAAFAAAGAAPTLTVRVRGDTSFDVAVAWEKVDDVAAGPVLHPSA